MQFTSKQVVTMVVAVCAAAVLTPAAVGAATGQLVNIVDPTTASRQAKVTSNGALSVGQHAAPPATAGNYGISKTGLGYINLGIYTNSSRLAVTDITLVGSGGSGVHAVFIEDWVRKGSTGSCSAPNTTDYNRHVLRRVSLKTDETVHLTFPGMPLLPNPATAAGTYGCFGVTVATAPAGSNTHVYAGTYRFSP
jgi:hypothetical protein